VVVPSRYSGTWDGRTVRNREGLVRYSRRLADRVEASLDPSSFLLVLGGDCSVLLGSMLALRRQGRYGLVFVDGHSDFRHPGNSPAVMAAAGEDLALVTGRGGPELANLEGRAPLVRDDDTVLVGFRPGDACADELHRLGFRAEDSAAVKSRGAGPLAVEIARWMETRPVDGFWVHLDVDVLDPGVMPAVDAPDPGGLGFEELAQLVRALTSSPRAAGMEVTVFDPDLDEDGVYAKAVADALVRALRP
jgi:arginase